MYRHCQNCVAYRYSDGFDSQGIYPGIVNTLQFDDRHTQLIEQLGKLDFLLKGQAKTLGCLLHGHITDTDIFHSLHAPSLIKRKSLRLLSLRDEFTFAVPP